MDCRSGMPDRVVSPTRSPQSTKSKRQERPTRPIKRSFFPPGRRESSTIGSLRVRYQISNNRLHQSGNVCYLNSGEIRKNTPVLCPKYHKYPCHDENYRNTPVAFFFFAFRIRAIFPSSEPRYSAPMNRHPLQVETQGTLRSSCWRDCLLSQLKIDSSNISNIRPIT